MRRKILVTGATGFVGRSLVSWLVKQDEVSVIAAVRRKSDVLAEGVEQVDGADIGPETDWKNILAGVTHVIHLGGVTASTAAGPAGAPPYQRVNVEGTLNLARQAAEAGVRRFVYLSSIGVNGEVSRGVPFTSTDTPRPANAYTRSKCDAESGLKKLMESASMELVIIRPPLVYGPRAPGKFGQLLRISNRRLVLPMGAIHNRRSYVALGNLVDLIATCIRHPAAANGVFLVSDGEDLSTTELLRRVGQALGKPARLVAIPVWLLNLGASLLGRQETARSLFGNLQIDISSTCKTLDWHPPFSVDEALREIAADFRRQGVMKGVTGV